MSKRVFFRPQRAKMRGSHEIVKSPVRDDDPYVLSPEQAAARVLPVVVVRISASNGQGAGRSVPDGATVRVGAPNGDHEDVPSVWFKPTTDEGRDRLVGSVTGFLKLRSTSAMTNTFTGVDWDDLVDILTRMGGTEWKP